MNSLKKMVEFFRMFFVIFRRSGTPYLALMGTIFCLVGVVIAWCRPAIGGTNGGGGRFSSNGTTMVGKTCGEGGEIAVLAGAVFFGSGLFLFVVGYRVTHGDDDLN